MEHHKDIYKCFSMCVPGSRRCHVDVPRILKERVQVCFHLRMEIPAHIDSLRVAQYLRVASVFMPVVPR